MKLKDWALVGVIAIFAGIASLVLSNMMLGNKKTSRLKVEVVEPISAEFKMPNQKYFNQQALNPTKVIQIGNDSNTTPFSGR